MARLTAAKRRKLPKRDFGFPKSESYPMEDKKHARAALARGKHDLSRRQYLTLARRVKKRHPTMKIRALGDR